LGAALIGAVAGVSEICLRPARPDDYDFAFRFQVETMKPYAAAFFEWVDKEQEDRFAPFATGNVIYSVDEINLTGARGNARC